MASVRNPSQLGQSTSELVDRTTKRRSDLSDTTRGPPKKRRGDDQARATTAVIDNLDTTNGHNPKQNSQLNPVSLKKGLRSENGMHSNAFLGTGSSENTSPKEDTSTKPVHTPGLHVKFDSEEPFPSAGQELHTEQAAAPRAVRVDDQDEVEAEDSSDEAPETISAAVGHENVRAAAAEAAKAAKIQQKAAKDLRRKRDSQLKVQASTASSSKRRRAKSLPEEEKKGGAAQLAEELLASGELPDFLPDEILSAEPAPAPTLDTVPLNRSRLITKLSDFSRPYKDVKAGSRVIRVLKRTSATLPPKFSKSSQNVRENWLRGIHRGNPGATPTRKPMKHSFIRK